MATVPEGLRIEGFASRPYIRYQNGIIYRQARFPRGLGTDPLTGLAGARVVAFAGAQGILPGLADRIAGFASYAEYDDQYVHSAMLAHEVVDAVIADRLIIDTYSRQVLGSAYDRPDQRLVFDAAFCPTWYRMVFRSDAVRQMFDAGLAQAEAAGEIAEIDARFDAETRMTVVERAGMDCPR